MEILQQQIRFFEISGYYSYHGKQNRGYHLKGHRELCQKLVSKMTLHIVWGHLSRKQTVEDRVVFRSSCDSSRSRTLEGPTTSHPTFLQEHLGDSQVWGARHGDARTPPKSISANLSCVFAENTIFLDCKKKLSSIQLISDQIWC